MADLPQIPGSSGPPQIPGGSDYSAGSGRIEVPKVPITKGTVDADRALPSTEPLKRRRRKKRIFGPFRVAHLVIALVIAGIGLARNSQDADVASKVKLSDINVPKIDVPKLGDDGAGDRSDDTPSKVPAGTVYRASLGDVTGHDQTAIEIGVRKGKIRWVAARRFPTTCDDGTSSSGLLFYTDEGRARGSGNLLRYADDTLNVTFSRDSGRGTVSYRSVTESRTCRGAVIFTAREAATSIVGQGLLDADRRAAEAFGG